MQEVEIRIKGRIDEHWSTWFADLAIRQTEQGETILTGSIADQATLYGVLNRLRDLGLPLVSVTQVERGSNTTEKEGLMFARNSTRHSLYQWSLDHPILISFVLLAIAVLLRVVDIMILPLAERWGEALLHKVLGFVLVLVYLWATGNAVSAIGLHRRRVGHAMLIGGAGMALILLVSFGLFWVGLRATGKEPAWVVAATDSKTGLAKPGVGFALWLILGNVVNAFMEEGLFRGVMLPHFRARLSPWRAIALQAVIFGLWHLAWPIRHLVAGRIGLGAALGQSIFIVVGSTISGLMWGYLFFKTDNLWAPWIAHVINNSTLNLLHVQTVDGLDANVAVLYATLAAGCLALLLLIRFWAGRLRMPKLQAWGSEA